MSLAMLASKPQKQFVEWLAVELLESEPYMSIVDL